MYSSEIGITPVTITWIITHKVHLEECWTHSISGLFISISTVKHRVHGIFWMQILHWVLNKHHLIYTCKVLWVSHSCSNFIEEKMRSKDISDLFKVTQWSDLKKRNPDTTFWTKCFERQTMEQHVFSWESANYFFKWVIWKWKLKYTLAGVHKAKNFISAWRHKAGQGH